MRRKKSRPWVTILGAILILIGLVWFFAPSLGLMSIAYGQTTIYCSDWDPQEWSWHLFSGQDVIPLPGCYIEQGWNTHICTTGTAIQPDLNYHHWICPGVQPQPQPEPTPTPTYRDVGSFHYAGIAPMIFGGVLIVLGSRRWF